MNNVGAAFWKRWKALAQRSGSDEQRWRSVLEAMKSVGAAFWKRSTALAQRFGSVQQRWRSDFTRTPALGSVVTRKGGVSARLCGPRPVGCIVLNVYRVCAELQAYPSYR